MPKMNFMEPSRACDLCPRLVEFRSANTIKHPTFHNAPVPSFGNMDAEMLIVGLAPGMKGANQTGRPFTGDYAGDLLYATLIKYGFADGAYGAHQDDGLRLKNCRITNAVKCVPPQNKPIGAEVNACRSFLIDEIAAMSNLKILFALGGLAHGAILTTFGERKSNYKFVHNVAHKLSNGLTLVNSYHCSRYNTNTGRLTTEMFEDVFETVLQRLKG
jgi:uracil-DNA glycosylase family 4